MHTANVLSEVLLPCEAGARAALAIIEGAKERLLCATMHLVHFALVAQETPGVGEALKFLTALDVTLVRPVVLVHVLAPFAFSLEQLPCAFFLLAVKLAICVSRGLLRALVANLADESTIIFTRH